MRTNALTLGLVLAVFSSSASWAQPLSPSQSDDDVLLAQNFRSFDSRRPSRDPDLEDDESLDQLMQIEYEKDAWSMTTAIGLSLVPGGGFGLVYARKKPQAVVPFLLSTLGYGLGIAYIAGTFDESQVGICTHVRDGRVPTEECDYARIPPDPSLPDRIDNSNVDPRGDGRQYWQTEADYTASTTGRNYSGRSTGVTILAATYVVTSALGAVWSGMSVRAHNRQLRRDIESTAGVPQRSRPAGQTDFFEPSLEIGRAQSTVGFTVRF